MRTSTATTTATTTPAATAGRFTARRRSLVTAAAWSVPVVAVASAAPAYATSRPTAAPMTTVVLASAASGTGIVPVVERCTTVAAGTVAFTGSIDGAPAPVGEVVTLSLPQGLAFASGGRDAEVRVTQAGLVQVPAFTATGAAGTYTVMASMRGELAAQSVSVVPAPGAVVELRRSTTTTATSAVFSTVAVAVTDAVAGAIQGDQAAASAGANGAVLTAAGTVRLWGAGTGATAAKPATLQFGGAAVTGAQFLDTWTSTGSGQAATADATGGVAASASTVWTWRQQGSSSTVARVTGLSGVVQGVAAEDGWSYALTSAGVYRWENPTSGTTVAAALVPGTAFTSSGTRMSAWSHRGPSDATLRHGGSAVNGRSVLAWTVASNGKLTTATSTLPTEVGTVAHLVATDSGLMVLGTNGTLWSWGTGFGATSWVQRASGVAVFSLWGYNSYIGGLWITTTGELRQFFGLRRFESPVIVRTGSISSGPALTGITKVFSSDGTYLALRNDGKVFAWGGNLDNPGRAAAGQIATGRGTTVDLNVWGHHLGDVYYGGGYVITGDVVC